MAPINKQTEAPHTMKNPIDKELQEKLASVILEPSEQGGTLTEAITRLAVKKAAVIAAHFAAKAKAEQQTKKNRSYLKILKAEAAQYGDTLTTRSDNPGKFKFALLTHRDGQFFDGRSCRTKRQLGALIKSHARTGGYTAIFP